LSGVGFCPLGLGLHKREDPPESEELAELWAPYINHCIDSFGPDRCMFASNFPVDKVSCGYTEMWNAYKIITKDLTEESK